MLWNDAGTDRGRARFRGGPVGDRDQLSRRRSIFRILHRSLRRSGAAISLSWAWLPEIPGGSRVSARLDQGGITCPMSKDCERACCGGRDRDTGASPALSIQPTWDMPPPPAAGGGQCAQACLKAAHRKATSVCVPFRWWEIALLIRLLPAGILRSLKFQTGELVARDSGRKHCRNEARRFTSETRNSDTAGLPDRLRRIWAKIRHKL